MVYFMHCCNLITELCGKGITTIDCDNVIGSWKFLTIKGLAECHQTLSFSVGSGNEAVSTLVFSIVCKEMNFAMYTFI